MSNKLSFPSDLLRIGMPVRYSLKHNLAIKICNRLNIESLAFLDNTYYLTDGTYTTVFIIGEHEMRVGCAKRKPTDNLNYDAGFSIALRRAIERQLTIHLSLLNGAINHVNFRDAIQNPTDNQRANVSLARKSKNGQVRVEKHSS